MTDPFKNQRYSMHSAGESYSSLPPLTRERELAAKGGVSSPQPPGTTAGSSPIKHTASRASLQSRLSENIFGTSDASGGAAAANHSPNLSVSAVSGSRSDAIGLCRPQPLLRQQQQQQQVSGSDAYTQAFRDANKEVISQLKSNIELLFKGARLLGQVSLYPLRALRWQCQIHSESMRCHLTPFTLMPVIYNLSYPGYMSLWKGCFSMAAYNGIKTILESVIGELTGFEKNIDDIGSFDKLQGHLLLKLTACAITTSIFTAVVHESVQSGISNESFGLLDLMRETRNRITGYRYNYRTRLIALRSLIVPTSLYFVGVHCVAAGLERLLHAAHRKFFNAQDTTAYGVDEVEVEVVERPYLNAFVQLCSQMGALVLLYPFETVLTRLMVQGTRTIIDNTDMGFGFVPINTRYDGFLDCVHMIRELEGWLGFYKGLGTVVIEAALHVALFKLARLAASRIYDAEWTTRTDKHNAKQLMDSGGLTQLPPLPPAAPAQQVWPQRQYERQQQQQPEQQRDYEVYTAADLKYTSLPVSQSSHKL